MPKELLSSKNPIEEESDDDNGDEKLQLSFEQILQLQEQIRKFVQLLTQFYLLSYGEKLSNFNESSKQILVELGNLASENIMFNAYNLNGALNIVNTFDAKKDPLGRKLHPKGIPYIIRHTIVNSKVFMYPELLPTRGFDRRHSLKTIFTKAEDNLIALGLERFSDVYAPLHEIHIHLLPCKKESQIKFRIKNLKASKAPEDNPIKYYYKHKEAPPMPRNIQIFDPNNVKAPKNHSPKDLPEWMLSYATKIRPKSMETIYQPLFILPKGIIIQNGNVSLVAEQFSVNNIIKFEKRMQKLPYILPKGTITKDKEHSSNNTDISGSENHTNSNTECESKQENLATKCNKNDTQNTTTDKPLIILNAESNEYNNIEVIEKNEVQDKSMKKHLVVLGDKYSKISIDNNVKNDAVQNSEPLIINHSKNNEKSNTKDINKKIDALDKIVSNESINSKGKSLKKVIIMPLYTVDDKNNENKMLNSNSSTLLNIGKSKKEYARKLSSDQDCIVSPKKQNDTGLSGSENHTNSNTKCKSKQINLATKCNKNDKNNTQNITTDKPLITLNAESNEYNNIEVIEKNVSLVAEQFSVNNIKLKKRMYATRKNKVKPVQKLPYILPKGTIRKDTELSSNDTDLSGSENHTNSNTKCESKEENLTTQCNKNDKNNTQNVTTDKPLIILNAESNEYNKIQDKSMTEHLVALKDKYSKISIDNNIKIAAIQDSEPLILSHSKNNEKNYTKDINKKIDAFDKIVPNESINSKGKSRKRCLLNKVVIRPLYMVGDKNKKLDSNSSTILNIDKSEKECAKELSKDEDCIVSPKKQKFSMTDDYSLDSIFKERSIINAEIMDENRKSVENVSVVDSISPVPSDSSFYSVNCKSLSNAYIDNAISNKCSDLQTRTYKFRKNNKVKIKKSKSFHNAKDKISNLQKNECNLSEQNDKKIDKKMQSSKYDYDVNSDKCINELSIALRNGKRVQNVNNLAFLYENKNKISDTYCKIPGNVNKRLLSSNDVVTKSFEYITDTTGKGSDIIIKSEFIEEICDSSQDAWYSNCENATGINSNLLDGCINTQHSNFAESKIKTTHNAKGFSEMIPSVINQSQDEKDTFCETLKNVNKTLSSENCINMKSAKLPLDSSERNCDIVIKSEVLEEEFSMDCEGTVVLNSNLLNSCINKHNSNFEYGDEKKDIKDATTFSETIKMIDVCDIKQEIIDDFEDTQTCESVHDVETHKCNTFEATAINDKQEIRDIKCTVNNKQVMKTIDYFPNSTDRECGIIIKSEFVEESNEALEDVCKNDYNQTDTLFIDSNSTAENYNSSSRKRNLRSANQINLTKRNKILHDKFDNKYEFPKSAKTVFARANACREKIPIKSEIIHDGETSLQNNSETIYKEQILNTTKSIIGSNSLEKAHLKRSNRIANQKRKKSKLPN